jgi:hypothetical protein
MTCLFHEAPAELNQTILVSPGSAGNDVETIIAN